MISILLNAKKRKKKWFSDKLNFYDLCKRTISSSYYFVRLPNTVVIAADNVSFSCEFSFSQLNDLLFEKMIWHKRKILYFLCQKSNKYGDEWTLRDLTRFASAFRYILSQTLGKCSMWIVFVFHWKSMFIVGEAIYTILLWV